MNDILRELSELSDVAINHRKFSSKLINLSFLLYKLWPSSYQLLRVYMPFSSHSKIYEHIILYLPIINGLKTNEIYKILRQTIYFASQSKKPVQMNLGIDAICVVASSKMHIHILKICTHFTYYLMQLKQYFLDEKEIHLILDLYMAHLTEKVKSYALGLKIILHLIPSQMTDIYRPLDRSIFGPFKTLARCYFRNREN